jgi:glutamine amidotransferase
MLAILDYDAGNIESVRSALAHVGGEPVFVKDAAEAAHAERIVFPGVGSAAQCMRNLRARKFDTVLADAIARGTPVLAICIGMQLLFDSSDEDGGVDALGLLPGKAVKFAPTDRTMKVPHMGWNRTDMPRRHPLLPESLAGADFYFVHSYYVQPAQGADCAYGLTDYADVRFTAMAGRGSLFACQFHPEKSGAAGLDILRRFLEWDGKTGDAPC